MSENLFYQLNPIKYLIIKFCRVDTDFSYVIDKNRGKIVIIHKFQTQNIKFLLPPRNLAKLWRRTVIIKS
jgi:hypothetical protein